MTPYENYSTDVEEAFKAISEGSTTFAVRDTEMDGIEIKKGQFISLKDKAIIASEDKMIDSFKVLFDKVVEDAEEEITIIHNNDVSKEDLATIKG